MMITRSRALILQSSSQLRSLSTVLSADRPSYCYLEPASIDHKTSPKIHSTPALNPADRTKLEQIIRVDQAGELAANFIYRGQLFVTSRDPRRRQESELVQEMWDQEKHHLRVMNALSKQHRVSPTLLTPVAEVGGFLLGAVTSLIGKEAGMACTEAVETVIGEHYDDQLRSLASFPDHPSIPLLNDVITEFRDDELEHLNAAVENGAHQAPAHALLSAAIGGLCKAAIWGCERV